MEQSFVDFLSVMPHASSDSVRDMAVGNMLSRAASDSLALDLTGWLAETYLNSTDSPMYSEGTYIMFLDRLAFSDQYRRGHARTLFGAVARHRLQPSWRRCRRLHIYRLSRDKVSIRLHFSGRASDCASMRFFQAVVLGSGARTPKRQTKLVGNQGRPWCPVATPAMASGRSSFSE